MSHNGFEADPAYADDERFADWVDGRLQGDALAAFEAELAADPALRAQAEAYRGTVALVRQHLQHDEPPVELTESILAQLPGAQPTSRVIPLLASLTAAAAMIVFGFVLWNMTTKPDVKEDGTAHNNWSEPARDTAADRQPERNAYKRSETSPDEAEGNFGRVPEKNEKQQLRSGADRKPRKPVDADKEMARVQPKAKKLVRGPADRVPGEGQKNREALRAVQGQGGRLKEQLKTLEEAEKAKADTDVKKLEAKKLDKRRLDDNAAGESKSKESRKAKTKMARRQPKPAGPTTPGPTAPGAPRPTTGGPAGPTTGGPVPPKLSPKNKNKPAGVVPDPARRAAPGKRPAEGKAAPRVSDEIRKLADKYLRPVGPAPARKALAGKKDTKGKQAERAENTAAEERDGGVGGGGKGGAQRARRGRAGGGRGGGRMERSFGGGAPAEPELPVLLIEVPAEAADQPNQSNTKRRARKKDVTVEKKAKADRAQGYAKVPAKPEHGFLSFLDARRKKGEKLAGARELDLPQIEGGFRQRRNGALAKSAVDTYEQRIGDEVFEVQGSPGDMQRFFIALRDYLKLKRVVGKADDAKDAKPANRRGIHVRHLTGSSRVRVFYRMQQQPIADKRAADERAGGMRFLVVLRPR